MNGADQVRIACAARDRWAEEAAGFRIHLEDAAAVGDLGRVLTFACGYGRAALYSLELDQFARGLAGIRTGAVGKGDGL